MDRVTLSARHQVVIPKGVRERLGLVPGQEVEVLAHDGRIELIPVPPVRQLRGFLEGIESSVERERDRR